jgi:chitinase
VTNWSQYRPGKAVFLPEKIDPFLCTHVIIAYAAFTKGGSIMAVDAYDEGPNGFYHRTVNLRKQNPSLKILISVGGADFGARQFSTMAKSFLTRTNFVSTSLSFLKKHDFDGMGIFLVFIISLQPSCNLLN